MQTDSIFNRLFGFYQVQARLRLWHLLLLGAATVLAGAVWFAVSQPDNAKRMIKEQAGKSGFLPSDQASNHSRVKSKRPARLYRAGAPINTSPVAANGMVYFGSGEGFVHAVDAATYKERWRVNRGMSEYSSPTVAGESVFFGSNDGRLYSLSARSGELKWAYDTGVAVVSGPAIVKGTAFVGSSKGNFYAIDTASGKLRWRASVASNSDVTPAVAGASVFVVGVDSSVLHALDAKTGKERWQYDANTGAISSSPRVAYGMVFFCTAEGRLIGLQVKVLPSLRGSRGNLREHGL